MQMPTTWLALASLRAGRAHAGLCHASSCDLKLWPKEQLCYTVIELALSGCELNMAMTNTAGARQVCCENSSSFRSRRRVPVTGRRWTQGRSLCCLYAASKSSAGQTSLTDACLDRRGSASRPHRAADWTKRRRSGGGDRRWVTVNKDATTWTSGSSWTSTARQVMWLTTATTYCGVFEELRTLPVTVTQTDQLYLLLANTPTKVRPPRQSLFTPRYLLHNYTEHFTAQYSIHSKDV